MLKYSTVSNKQKSSYCQWIRAKNIWNTLRSQLGSTLVRAIYFCHLGNWGEKVKTTSDAKQSILKYEAFRDITSSGIYHY